MNAIATDLVYLFAGSCFVLALKWMSAPTTARRGIRAGEIGMLAAVIATLLQKQIVEYQWIAIGLVIGTTIGALMAIFMPITAMPQRIALSHAFGALAAALVGTAEFYLDSPHIAEFKMSVLGAEVLLGYLTFTGSLMAFGKLQELIPTRPIVYRGQNVVNLSILAAAVLMVVLLVIDPSHKALFPILAVLSLV